MVIVMTVPVTIIGSGLAGYTLVREIRRLDKTCPITVITLNNGDYYSKPQLSNALTHQKSPEQLVLISAEKFAAQFNINIIPHTTIESLNAFSGNIILATGAVPVKIPSCFLFSVNNLEDYQQFRQQIASEKKITVLGAGLVGCEFANDLINSGYDVTVIAPEKYPLARLVPEEVGMSLYKTFAEKGVQWRLGEFFNPEEKNSGVILSAIGLRPEISLAQSAGIVVNKGIIVDTHLRTNQENIYALGDCIEFEGRLLPYIAPIAIGARALAKTLLGEPTPVIYPPMPIYIKTPAYPVVVLTPSQSEGEWVIEKNQTAVRALFYHENTLKGFALGGTYTAEAVEWVKKI
jgi:rubredoxin-NAD+ reductase